MFTRLRAAPALVALAAFALTLLIAFRALGGVEFSARIEGGLQPRMTVADVKTVVTAKLDAMASAVDQSAGGSAEAIAITLDRIDELIVDTPILEGGGWKGSSVVWVVRAHATFVTFRGRSPEPRTADSGWFIVDDATGGIIAMGFPLKTP